MKQRAEPEQREIFARRLRMAMFGKKIGLHELSRRSGVSYGTVCYILDEKGLPNGSTIFKLCRALGMSADWLLGLKN